MAVSHWETLESYLPIPLDSWGSIGAAYGISLFFILLRYFLLVGLFYGYFYKKSHSFPQVNRRRPSKSQIQDEVKWSLVSSGIFALFGVVIAILWQRGYGKIYLAFDEYGLWYLPVSFLLLSAAHELYFYITHRLMHHPKLFKTIHSVHHASIHTSPWASFSFHPGEAVVEALILPLLICIIPTHPVVLLAYLTFMTLSAIVNHLGFEIMGTGLQRVFISASHHGLHHTHFNGNYGLYYRFMDQVGGTELPPVKAGHRKYKG